MTISVHAYSGNPEARPVGIGSRILREGDYVVPGLKLEQITPDGMVFGYKGFRFRRGVKYSGLSMVDTIYSTRTRRRTDGVGSSSKVVGASSSMRGL